MSGIYQIYNPINNKRYIGSSINVERRLKEHLRNLEKNRHCNDHLQSAYNKYKDVLQFQFLEECEPDECLIFEQYYIEQAIFPDERTRELVENVDKTYGTNYKRAYSNIAYKDMTKRGSYVKWGNTDKDGYGQINIKNIKDNVLPTDINDYNIVLDNNIYMPGTANHELGHVADGLAGSRKIQDFDSGKEYITNTYLNYLANSNNTYSSAELRKMGLFDAAGSRSYLLNPTEAKSHMLTLKRSLKDSGKITNWSTPVDENMILEYMRNPTSNKMVKNQYDLYRNKNEYIDRLNKLIPMEILMPLGGAGFVGHELNKE